MFPWDRFLAVELLNQRVDFQKWDQWIENIFMDNKRLYQFLLPPTVYESLAHSSLASTVYHHNLLCVCVFYPFCRNVVGDSVISIFHCY